MTIENATRTEEPMINQIRNVMNNNPNRGDSRKEKQMNATTRTASAAVLIALGLSLGVQAAESPKQETRETRDVKATEVSRQSGHLPFTITMTEEKMASLPDYMSQRNPVDMDFPYSPVMIDGEYWIMYKNGYRGPVFRFKGTTIENAVRQPDGAAKLPNGAYLLGGMWYDAESKTLYAPIHFEVEKRQEQHDIVLREIHLASSRDKGLTWKHEGALLSGGQRRPASESSGLQFDGGDGDFILYVDERGGYIYLFTSHYVQVKRGAPGQAFLRHRVARCAIADKMAPGKWQRFYNGAWTEPGVGGKGSYVNAFTITYNQYVKKYLSFNYLSGLSWCDDLGKQDWSGSYHIGDGWGINRTWGYWITNAERNNTTLSDQTMYAYRFWQSQSGRRFRLELGTEEMPPRLGFSPPGMWLMNPVTCHHGRTMDPGQQYGYTPWLESCDPIEARRTRRVGCQSPETRYDGPWTEVRDGGYNGGVARQTVEKGARVSLAFTGEDIYWRAVKGPDQGLAEVHLDGAPVAVVDCWASEPTLFQFAFIKRGLTKGPHTISVVAKGEKGPLSSGTAIRHMLFEHAADTWRASDCFSSIQGKNQWRYQQRVDGTAADLTIYAPHAWRAADGAEIGFFHMIPTPATGTVRLWTAPHDGVVRIEGTPGQEGGAGNDVTVSIRKGNETLWSEQLVPTNRPTAAHDLNTTVRAGETLAFAATRRPPTVKAAPPGPELVVLANNDRVLQNSRAGTALKIGTREFQRGLFCHAVSKVRVVLPGPARAFSAVAGVDANNAPDAKGSVVFSVRVGDTVAFRSDVLRGKAEGVPVAVDLKGARELLLEAGDAGDGISWDWAVWADARVTLEDGKELWLGDIPLRDDRTPPAVPRTLWDPVITYGETTPSASSPTRGPAR